MTKTSSFQVFTVGGVFGLDLPFYYPNIYSWWCFHFDSFHLLSINLQLVMIWHWLHHFLFTDLQYVMFWLWPLFLLSLYQQFVMFWPWSLSNIPVFGYGLTLTSLSTIHEFGDILTLTSRYTIPVFGDVLSLTSFYYPYIWWCFDLEFFLLSLYLVMFWPWPLYLLSLYLVLFWPTRLCQPSRC